MRPFRATPALAQGLEPSPEVLAWVREVSKPYAGTTLRLATESTPPSNAINSQLKQYFEEASGMKVEIEVLPLEQVLQKLTLDIASQLGSYDLYYIDQSWAASVSRDVFDPREQLEDKPDLAMPDYNIDDFLPALVADPNRPQDHPGGFLDIRDIDGNRLGQHGSAWRGGNDPGLHLYPAGAETPRAWSDTGLGQAIAGTKLSVATLGRLI